MSRSESEEIRAHTKKCVECAAILEEEMAFACKLAAIPEEKPVNDVWALVRIKTKPRGLHLGFVWNAVGVRARRLVALGAALIAVVAFACSFNEPVSVPTRPLGKVIVVASDDPLAKQTDTMIAIMERM